MSCWTAIFPRVARYQNACDLIGLLPLLSLHLNVVAVIRCTLLADGHRRLHEVGIEQFEYVGEHCMDLGGVRSTVFRGFAHRSTVSYRKFPNFVKFARDFGKFTGPSPTFVAKSTTEILKRVPLRPYAGGGA